MTTKRTIKAFAILGEQGHLAVYGPNQPVHPYLIFRNKSEAAKALWEPNEKVVPVTIAIEKD